MVDAGSNFGVGSWITRRARTHPDRLALVGGGRSLTYAEMASRVRRVANGLLELGVRRGDRVAWLGPNHPAFLESLFACGLVGAALAPVNHRLAAGQLRAILEDTAPRVLIQHGVAGPDSPVDVARVTVGAVADGALGFETLASRSADRPIDVSVDLTDICLLPHTSGTTGGAKAVMLTHANVTSNVVNLLSCADVRPDDVTLAIAPFFRAGGTGVNVLPVLFLGGTVVIPDDTSPQGILQAMHHHQVTVGFGNPDLLEALAASAVWPHVDLSSIRFVLTGGAPVPERLIRTYLDRGVTLVQGYGLSEAAPTVLLLDPADALLKIGSAGKPLLLVDVRIVSDDGTPVGPGEIGELHARGPNVMAGYWNQPEATRSVLTADGWLRTGDAARADEQGYIWIVDRMADRFSSDGRAVYPGEVERVLMDHPAVADAGVVQVPAAPGRQVLVAVVVRVGGASVSEDELRRMCGERLPAHQTPARVRFVDQLPRSSVGKLMRAQLRTLAAGEPTAT